MPDRPVPQHIWRPMTTLRDELPLDDALGLMRAAASHLAAVADGSGRVLGLVALEDVLEMLVGEVRDPAHPESPFADGARRPPGQPPAPDALAPAPREGAAQPQDA